MQARRILDVGFGAEGNCDAFLGEGWSRPEGTFVWTEGDTSELRFATVRAAGGVRLEIQLRPHVNLPALPEQRLHVLVNGVLVCSARVAQDMLLEVPVPADAWPRSGEARVRLVHPDAARPSDLGPSADTRALAFAVHRLTVYAEPVATGGLPSADGSALRLPPQRAPIDLAFTDDAIMAEGVPANFKGAADYIQVSPMVKHAEYSAMRRMFRHRRLSGLGDDPAYLVLGMFGSPVAWLGGGSQRALAEAVGEVPSLMERHKGLRLLLDYSWEGATYPEIIGQFDQTVIALGVDPARVSILVANSAVAARHAAHLAARPEAPRYRLFGHDMFLAYCAAEAQRRRWFSAPDALVPMQAVDDARARERRYKFLSLNRRPRWHRFMLALMVRRLGLREAGAISMPSTAYEGDWVSEAHMLDRYGALMSPSSWAGLQAAREATLNALPWVIDENMDRSGHTSHFAFDRQDRIPYLDSYLNVVTESYFEGEPGDVFITEKTCKAVLGLQPFIVFGHRGTLARMDGLGFARPLAGVLDGYDDLPDGGRLDALYQGLAQVAAWSMADIHALYHDSLDALQHNRERLFAMPDVIGRALEPVLRAGLA